MKQYDNRFVVAVLICLKEIIFHISSYLNFCVCKYTNFLFSTVGRNIAANECIYAIWRVFPNYLQLHLFLKRSYQAA